MVGGNSIYIRTFLFISIAKNSKGDTETDGTSGDLIISLAPIASINKKRSDGKNGCWKMKEISGWKMEEMGAWKIEEMGGWKWNKRVKDEEMVGCKIEEIGVRRWKNWDLLKACPG